jgi:hypothetical protein
MHFDTKNYLKSNRYHTVKHINLDPGAMLSETIKINLNFDDYFFME